MSEQYFVHVSEVEGDERSASGPFFTDKAAIEFAEREGERLAEALAIRPDLGEHDTRYEWAGGRLLVWQATAGDTEDVVYEITIEEELLED